MLKKAGITNGFRGRKKRYMGGEREKGSRPAVAGAGVVVAAGPPPQKKVGAPPHKEVGPHTHTREHPLGRGRQRQPSWGLALPQERAATPRWRWEGVRSGTAVPLEADTRPPRPDPSRASPRWRLNRTRGLCGPTREERQGALMRVCPCDCSCYSCATLP